MRHLVLYLRWSLAHHAGKLALDPGVGAKVFKAGLVKTAGSVTAGLVIPVSALAAYTIPASTIHRLTSPIVGAAPDIFDVRGLADLSRKRIRAALRDVDSVRDALGPQVDALGSDQTVSDTISLDPFDVDILPVGVSEEEGASPPALEPPPAPPGEVFLPGPGWQLPPVDDEGEDSVSPEEPPDPGPPAEGDAAPGDDPGSTEPGSQVGSEPEEGEDEPQAGASEVSDEASEEQGDEIGDQPPLPPPPPPPPPQDDEDDEDDDDDSDDDEDDDEDDDDSDDDEDDDDDSDDDSDDEDDDDDDSDDDDD